MLQAHDLSQSEVDLLQRASLRIHPRDNMYKSPHAGHYLYTGLGALRCIDRALEGRGGSIQKILVLPSGYGRVLRFLRARYPDAAITASEVLDDALEFCRDEFAATILRSTEDLSGLDCDDRFDLIWSGSLATHLTKAGSAALLKFFADHLASGGVCVFTTHGPHSYDSVRYGYLSYGHTDEELDRLLRGYRESGYGFVRYEGSADYGTSMVSPDCLREIAREAGLTRETLYWDRGWDAHQDAWGFTRDSA